MTRQPMEALDGWDFWQPVHHVESLLLYLYIYIYIFVTILHGVLGYCYRPGVFDLASTKLSA